MWFQENEITHACDQRSVTDPHPVSPPKKEKKYFKQQTYSIQSSCGMQTGEYLVFWLIWTSRMAYYLTRSGENINKNVEFQVMTMFSENKLNYLKCIKNLTNDILTGGLVGWGPENSVPSTIKEAMKPCCLQKFHASQSLKPKKSCRECQDSTLYVKKRFHACFFVFKSENSANHVPYTCKVSRCIPVQCQPMK